MKRIATFAAALSAIAITTAAFAQDSATSTNATGSTNASGTNMSASQSATGTSTDATQPTGMSTGSTGAGMQASTTGAAGSTQLSSDEKSFIKEAAEGSHAEIQHAQLAQQKAQNPQVKQLAQQIAQDHQQATQALQPLAQQANVQTPTELKGDHKDMQEKLQKAEGAEFDKQYAKEMIKAHKKDIKKFEEMAKDAKNPLVQQFAQQTLPKLQQHLQMAQAAAGEKSDSASTSGNSSFQPTASYQVNQPGTAGSSTGATGSTGMGTGSTGSSSTSPSGTSTGNTGSSSGTNQ